MVQTGHAWQIIYKRAKNKKIQQWQISVVNLGPASAIDTHHGYVDGLQQTTRDIIHVGKNIGKSNETTHFQQAFLEAQSKFQKQLDRGYKREIAEVDTNTHPAFLPMLAHKYTDHQDKITFPCLVQPKLDGLRATWDDGFYSRVRKPFPEIPHLRAWLEHLQIDHLPLDGELYSHELKDNFEEIVSMVKRGKTHHPDIMKLEYHIFDVAQPGDYHTRVLEVERKLITPSPIKFICNSMAKNHEDIDDLLEHFLEAGYEGVMVRTIQHPYEHNRSYSLQKYKKFIDAEFPIVGFKEGRGKLMGHVGAFVCRHLDNTFDVKLEGKTQFLKKCFDDHSLWLNKEMTVKFQGFTRKNNVPRFPVGLRIRED